MVGERLVLPWQRGENTAACKVLLRGSERVDERCYPAEWCEQNAAAFVALREELRSERECVRALREYVAGIAEAVAMERRTLEDSLAADHWIGYATPLASVARIEAAVSVLGEGVSVG